MFTGRSDDRYGAGGTFDTNDDGNFSIGTQGEWGGLYAGRLAQLSLDNVVVANAGGIVGVEGTFAGFNAVEVHEADARIANSLFEHNADGRGGQSTPVREGRGVNGPAAIFVVSSQPIIVNNEFRDNAWTRNNSAVPLASPNMSTISINAGSFTATNNPDYGRQTGLADLFLGSPGNKGPLVRGNEIGNSVTATGQFNASINGLFVRPQTLTTESVWDDTDIVHVLAGEIIIPNFHTYGGLRLQSSASESLVVKLQGTTAGFTASGTALDITDRIGGRLHVVGAPGFPVVFTDLADDTVTAGFDPDGLPKGDTNGNGATTGTVGSWRGLVLNQFSHDRNVETVAELEGEISGFGDLNGTTGAAQVIGQLAQRETASDENLRLGFTITGALAEPNDVDVYTFEGTAGTMVWLDIDRTEFGLDTVLELIDADGNTLAISDNSRVESANQAVNYSSLPAGTVQPLQQSTQPLRNLDNSYRDLYSVNATDAGLRLLLPGSPGTKGSYSIRVRSNPLRPSDVNVNTSLAAGITSASTSLTLTATPAALGLPVAAPFSLMLQDTTTGRQEVVRVVEPYNPTSATLTVQRGLVGTQSASFTTASTQVIYTGLLDQDRLTDGLSSGSYQLQIRLQETDEFGGSTIRYADIRFATNGVQILGLPNHSPLAGGVTSTAGTVYIGDIGASDRGALFASGSLTGAGNLNTYRFDVTRMSVVDGDTLTQASTAASGHISATIDVDYADGLGRPNTSAYLFNGNTLVAMGTDSNISDDRTTSLNSTDLSRGSSGVLDPFIGPIELDVNGNYNVVVSPTARMPADLLQYTSATPPNRLARLEPLDGTNRLSEDRFNVSTGGNQTPASLLPFVPATQAPSVTSQLSFTDANSNLTTAVQWHLGDIPLMAMEDHAGGSYLSNYNPFTGNIDSILTDNTAGPGAALSGNAGQALIGSFAGDADGNMVAISRAPGNAWSPSATLNGNATDGNSGVVYRFDTNGTRTTLGSTGIVTFENRNNGGNPVTFSNVTSASQIVTPKRYSSSAWRIGIILTVVIAVCTQLVIVETLQARLSLEIH